MHRFKKIFFATDFSDCAAHAQLYAFALAERFGAILHVGHVVDTAYPSYAGVYGFGAEVDLHIEEVKKHAQESLVQVTDLARAQGLDAHPHLLGGRPAEEIIQKAQNAECDLIVIGTHGRSGFDHFLFGSTCERVVRFSSIPVLSVKSREREFVEEGKVVALKRVLCPCDLSNVSEQAVPLAVDICRIFESELVLLHVIDSRVEYPLLMPGAQLPTSAELHDYAVKRLNEIASQYSDVKSVVEVISGVPHSVITDYAKEHEADLIAMTTHGRMGLTRALLGSTTEKVVRTATMPTLTARPLETAQDEEGAAEGVPGKVSPAPA